MPPKGIFRSKGFPASRALIGPGLGVDALVPAEGVTGSKGFPAERALINLPFYVYFPMVGEVVPVGKSFPADVADVRLAFLVQLLMSAEGRRGPEGFRAERALMLVELVFQVDFLMMSEGVPVDERFPADGAFVRLAFDVDLMVSTEGAFSFERFPAEGAFVRKRLSATGFRKVQEEPAEGGILPLVSDPSVPAFHVDSLVPSEIIMSRVVSPAASALVAAFLLRHFRLANGQCFSPKALPIRGVLRRWCLLVASQVVLKILAVSKAFPTFRAHLKLLFLVCLGLRSQQRTFANRFPTVKASVIFHLHVGNLVFSERTVFLEDFSFAAWSLPHAHTLMIKKSLLLLVRLPTMTTGKGMFHPTVSFVRRTRQNFGVQMKSLVFDRGRFFLAAVFTAQTGEAMALAVVLCLVLHEVLLLHKAFSTDGALKDMVPCVSGHKMLHKVPGFCEAFLTGRARMRLFTAVHLVMLRQKSFRSKGLPTLATFPTFLS